MYCAKQRGRNSLQFFHPAIDASTQEKVQLEADLHVALATGQLQVHYQPKVNIHNGLVNGAEALLRWFHPTRGLVSPAVFIPIAEECGLIGAIGAWVMREACGQACEWARAVSRPMRVAVNLSASQFRRNDVVEMIDAALRAAGLPADLLEVELTESAVMSDPEESIAILERLSRMGVTVSVDDFGTGYSSLSYLRRFPIDKLKIDRSFIADVLTRAEDASIVRAIISLAHSLKLKVVAEGVETAEQVEFLRSLDCDHYQGYFYSAAVPSPRFMELVRAESPAGATEEFDPGRTYSKLAAFRPG